MATINKVSIQSNITTGIRTGSGDTTAAELRAVLGDVLDSYANVVDGGFVYQTPLGYNALIAITDPKSFVYKKYVEDNFQVTLVSGTNLKTVNSTSLLGPGNISVGIVTSLTVATANGFAGSFTGGATPVLTIQTSVTGILYGDGTLVRTALAADFPTLNQNTTGTASDIPNAAVIAKVLTGLSVSGSTVTAADSILVAVGKLQNQVNGLMGGAHYQGTYNATTNTPALVDGTGTQGWYYVVTVAGTQNYGSGAIVFGVGDWVIYNGAIWQKVDNTDAVISVNGYIGIVVLTGNDILLTGYAAGAAGAVASTDNVVQAFVKTGANISLKANTASPTFTGTVTTPAIVVSSETASTIASFDGSKNIKSLALATYPSLTELSYGKGVTSAIQTQLDSKITASSTDTLTNKRNPPRVYSTTTLTTLTPEKDTYDEFALTALVTGLTIANHSTTTPSNGEKILINIYSSSAQSLTFGTNYVAKAGVALPSTTIAGKITVLGFRWDSNISKYNLLALGQEA